MIPFLAAAVKDAIWSFSVEVLGESESEAEPAAEVVDLVVDRLAEWLQKDDEVPCDIIESTSTYVRADLSEDDLGSYSEMIENAIDVARVNQTEADSV